MSKEGILITGTTGFIGSATTEALKNTESDVRKFRSNVCEVADWEKSLKGGEIIFLIAGIRTETNSDFAVNARSAEVLFSAAARLNKLPKRIILASTQAVYMGNRIPFEETQKPHPTTVYGKSKLLGEEIVERWCQKLKIPLVILRYSTVLGAGVREKSKMSGPLFVWTKAALVDGPIEIFQDGNQTRDYIHIDDVVNANILAIGLPDGIYNVGGGKLVKLIELANWIKEVAGGSSEIVIFGGGPSESDPREMFSDTTKLKSYGWEPRKTAKEAVWEFVTSFA